MSADGFFRTSGHWLHEQVVDQINWLYKRYVRPWLFERSAADNELAHEWAINRLAFVSRHATLRRLLGTIGVVRDPRLEQHFLPLDLCFPTPVGLAAGFDKYGTAFPALAACGFCPVEIGGFTQHQQEGKPHPRVFRLPEDEAMINRMGFNNPGASNAAINIQRLPRIPVPLGINLAKSLVTPLEQAAVDYKVSLSTLYDVGDYFVVNVSSPNTPELRKLQTKEYLRALLQEVLDCRKQLVKYQGLYSKPIFVKIAPDLTKAQIDEIIDACLGVRIDGIIAVNTTTSREGLKTVVNEEGGLSGPPLKKRAREIVQYIAERVPPYFFIIGVGGISCAEDAYDMLKAGARVVQLLTALPYQGLIAPKINLGLLRLMERDGIEHVSELWKKKN